MLTAEPLIRLSVFAAVFTAMALWELFAPHREPARARRWPGNLGILVLDALVVRVLFPTAAVGVALWAESRGIGLLPALGTPAWLAIPIAVILLDLLLWAQHYAFHHIRLLWPLHRMHHADTMFDVTTGLRFHPVEIVISLLLKMAAVVALGAPSIAVVVFEVLLNAASMFSHGNVRLPAGLDRAVRRVLVTPDMHRVHHSVVRAETDSNFGFCLSVWDRLFGTYRAQPAAGHDAMTIGVPTFRDPAEARLDRLLTHPFRKG